MNEKNQTIVIRIAGDETIATRIPTGWPGDAMTRARTTRHPDDAFDAYIAARVALDRLFGRDDEQVFRERVGEKTSKPETPQWKVGDWIVATGSPISMEYLGKVGQVIGVNTFDGHCIYEAEFLDAEGRRVSQSWCTCGPDRSVRAATEEEVRDAEKVAKGQFQVGDIVRIVDPVPPTFDDYKKGDVAVVTKVDRPALYAIDWFYNIRIRSKERKDTGARVLGQELELVHRGGKKKGGAK